MQLFPFTLLVLLPGLRDYTEVQALVGTGFLFLSLLFILKKPFVLSLSDLPWLLWPLLLFTLTTPQWETFSESSLWIFSMFLGGLFILNPQHSVNRYTPQTLLLAHSGILLTQIIGIVAEHPHYSFKSLFGQENAYQFINLMGMAWAGYYAFFHSPPRFWKILALFNFVVGLISLYSGDYWLNHQLGPSAGDSIAVQVALVFGALWFALMILLKRLRPPASIYTSAAPLLTLLIISIPWILLNLPLWDNATNSSITSRLTLWQAIINMLQDHPILGVGVGGITVSIQDYYPRVSEALYPATHFYNVAHNHFLHQLAETGWLGALWYACLWLTPIAFCHYQYSKTQKTHFLYLGTWLLVTQAVLSILEVSQLFYSSAMATWFLLLYSKQQTLPPNKTFRFSAWWLLILFPLFIPIAMDRYTLLKSQALTSHLEFKGQLTARDERNLYLALEQNPKNSIALFYSADMLRLAKDYEKALKTVEYLDVVGGSRFSPRLRAWIYHDMGNDSLACQEAWRLLRFSIQKSDLEIKEQWANDCPLHWRHQSH